MGRKPEGFTPRVTRVWIGHGAERLHLRHLFATNSQVCIS